MKYLLDTCVLLWALEGKFDKIKNFVDIIEDDSNYIAVSVISYWEIAIKKSIGKLIFPFDLEDMVEQAGFSKLHLEYKHIAQLEKLPIIHNDPFDRLLIAQSMSEQCKLITVDQKILQYNLN